MFLRSFNVFGEISTEIVASGEVALLPNSFWRKVVTGESAEDSYRVSTKAK